MHPFFPVSSGDLATPSLSVNKLDSWKEIASFFCREVRTVQLWEKNEGLPVRRHHHRSLGSVYAYRHELKQWQKTRLAPSYRSWSVKQFVAPSHARAGAAQHSPKPAAMPSTQAPGALRSYSVDSVASSNPDQLGPAYHACMLGFHFGRQRTRSQLIKALVCFKDSIQIDPDYADAYAGLVETYASLSHFHFMPVREAMQAAQCALTRALALDSTSVNVRNAQVNFRKAFSGKWEAVDHVFQELAGSGQLSR